MAKNSITKDVRVESPNSFVGKKIIFESNLAESESVSESSESNPESESLESNLGLGLGLDSVSQKLNLRES